MGVREREIFVCERRERRARMSSSEYPDDDAECMNEIYEYEAASTIYSMGWSSRPDQRFRLALGTFIEDYTNRVNIVKLEPVSGTWQDCGKFEHPYPPTKIMWIPDEVGNKTDLLATSGDYLRLWEVCGDTDPPSVKQKPKCVLDTNKSAEVKFCAPLTSFDWNPVDSNIIGTSSIDTTCTIWDIETEQAKTQVIAHDKEVYDIGFQCNHPEIFASVGADGSLRMFDLRGLDQSTILYETPAPFSPALLRLAWNRRDEHFIATISMDSSVCVLLDTRYPSRPAAELDGHHKAPLNAIAWAPHSPCHITTAADDAQALIWDLSGFPAPIEKPALAYTAGAEINQLQWSSAQPSWIAIAFANHMQMLRV